MNMCLDQELLSELVEIMGDDMPMLITSYLDDTKAKLITMNRLQILTHQDDIFRLAHSLKGSSRNVGVIDFANYCEEIELLARYSKLTDKSFDLSKLNTLFEVGASQLSDRKSVV